MQSTPDCSNGPLGCCLDSDHGSGGKDSHWRSTSRVVQLACPFPPPIRPSNLLARHVLRSGTPGDQCAPWGRPALRLPIAVPAQSERDEIEFHDPHCWASTGLGMGTIQTPLNELLRRFPAQRGSSRHEDLRRVRRPNTRRVPHACSSLDCFAVRGP